MTTNRTPVDQQIDDLDLLIEAFALALQAANKSPATIAVYISGCRLFASYLTDQGMPRDVAHIRREHVEAWIVSLLANYKPATASNRFRCLQQFFKFAIEEGEISESPMRNMKPPTVPVENPGILSLDDLRGMLKACAGDSFDDIRDYAVLRVFMTTGARLAEVANLRLEDVVITRDERFIEVLGKGRKRRRLPLDNKTTRALNKYDRERRRRPGANQTDHLWMGHKGPMTISGVQQVVRRRANQAGLGDINPHALRHAFAHQFLQSGGQETDLMQLAGWSSRAMVQRYGAALASERAHDAYRRLGIGDRL